MSAKIETQMTPQGLLIPSTALAAWGGEELEVIQEPQAIIIRPKVTSTDLRRQVRQILSVAGLLYQPDWEMPAPVGLEERAYLAKKLAQGGVLSEVIMADRADRA
jgi:hypothetical protein